MTVAKAADTNPLTMSKKEFDRIMRKALQVKPQEEKPKKATKRKPARKRAK